MSNQDRKIGSAAASSPPTTSRTGPPSSAPRASAPARSRMASPAGGWPQGRNMPGARTR